MENLPFLVETSIYSGFPIAMLPQAKHRNSGTPHLLKLCTTRVERQQSLGIGTGTVWNTLGIPIIPIYD